MDVLEAIFTRRSVRKYTDEAVSKEQLLALVKAGMAAPSAGNEQSWHFIAIDDAGLLAKVPELSPYMGFAKNAPAAILICGDIPSQKYPGNWMLDCAAATQNVLLALHAEGLGGTWCGIWPEEERVEKFRDAFSVPQDIVPLSLIILGHPDQKLSKQERFVEEKLHWNTW